MADLSSHINISANNVSAIGNLSATNITGNVSTANTAATVTTAAQPNITSVGTLTSLSISGNANISALRVNSNNIVLGYQANSSSNTDSISIGYRAGNTNQGQSAIAIGPLAGTDTQGLRSVAIGTDAGTTRQGAGAVSIGFQASQSDASINTVSIGYGAQAIWGNNGVAIGPNSAAGANAVSIGYRSGGGENSLCLGSFTNYGAYNNNTILLNATGSNLDSITTNSFYVKPVRSNVTTQAMFYNTSTGEISYDLLSNYAGTINANTAATVTTAAQPNITSVGTLTSLAVTGNTTSGNFIGSLANGNSNVSIAAANGNVTISSAGNTTMTITGTGAIITGIAKPTGTSVTGVNSVLAGPTFTPLANTMGGFVSNVNAYTQLTIQNKNTGTDATTDFIATADNGSDTVNYLDMGIINSGYDANTPTNSLGNIVFAADTYMYAQGNTGNASQSGGNLAIGTTVPGKNVKIFAGGVNNSSIIANIANTGVTVTGNVTVSGGSFVGNGAGLTNVTVNAAGNIQGTSSNVSLVAGSYNWTFNNTGNLTLPGNTFSVNYANNTPVNPVTKFESSWTVPVGNSTQSFTVGLNETYYLWVDCNIPNGILTWNATATVTNNNVPVVGAQYAWVYTGGGTPIDFTSIPNQFVGTSNTIVRSNVAPSATTNRFDFGINNTSGGNATVRYGWVAIS